MKQGMLLPAVIVGIFYAGLLALAATGAVTLYGIVAAALVAQLASYLVFSLILFRHQKLLEWFANHVHLTAKYMPPDAPEDLLDWADDDDGDN